MIEPAVDLRATGLRAAGGSDPGRVRQNNEDRLYYDLERGIFLVVDGVGGHAAGEVAAAIAIDVIVDRLERGGASAERAVRHAIASANNEIHRLARRTARYSGMTCVVTVALLDAEVLTIGHVGDSRLYKITPGGFFKLTRDHSPVGEQEDSFEISETEAMRHPRRNEVFRDVGSAPHEPDDPEFIEITHARFEDDSAILLCTDGLSDMLSSSAIERLVRCYAGRPSMVVEALIGAANEAGGSDNVTAVYVEGVRFSGVRAPSAVEPPIQPRRPAASIARMPDGQRSPNLPETSSGPTRLAAGGRSVVSLSLALVVGLFLGLTSTVALDDVLARARGRVLVVGDGAFPSIAAAMAAASSRDIVRVEPGEYAEPVVVKDGVELEARVPGSVSLVAPGGAENWVAVTASGRDNRISGFRVVGRPEAPVAIGIKLDGRDLVLDDTAFEGNIEVAVDVGRDGDIVIRSSRFSEVLGLPLRVGPAARPLVRQNVFARGEGPGPAVRVEDEAVPTLEANVFVGYADAIGAPPDRRQSLLRGNFVIRGVNDAAR